MHGYRAIRVHDIYLLMRKAVEVQQIQYRKLLVPHSRTPTQLQTAHHTYSAANSASEEPVVHSDNLLHLAYNDLPNKT